MKVYALILSVCFCFISLPTFAGDEFISNELCGEAVSGKRQCFYVRELNFHLDGNLYGTESFNIYSKYLSDKVVEINKTLSDFNVKVTLKPFPKGAWFSRPKEKDSNIELTFLLTETIDKKFTMITFYSFSRGPFYIKTSQCPSDENACVVEEMKNILDVNVVKPMLENGN